jgi:hypothetical protein
MADDRNIAQSAIEVLKNLRGSGAPLAARTNDIINNLLGPHLGRSVAPVVALADVASMGADIRDTMEFSGDTVDSLRAGDYGKAAIDALYTAAAPLGIVLPGSVGMYREGAEEVSDRVLGLLDDVDPTMPRRLMPNEMRVFQGGPNLYGPDVPGTKPGLDSSKIGTGEGAQVYGHGHYLAENPGVGRGYKTSTSYADIKRKFLSELPQDADFDEAIDLAESGAFGDSGKRFIEALAADDWLGFDYPSQAISAALGKNIDNWDPSAALTKARENLGHLYEYDLPDETIAKMLDWDKPLSEQTPEVLDALGFSRRTEKEINDEALRLMEEGNALSGRPGGWLDIPETKARIDSLNDELNRVPPADVSGESYYRSGGQGGAFDIMSKMGAGSDPQVLSRQLREAGIPGIRYLDQGSRSGGKGTSNFVLFDDDAAKLLARDDTRFDLPTDEASRMARVREMGFDTDVYHGTDADIKSFDNAKRGRVTGAGSAQEAHWFVDNPDTAGGYSDLASSKAVDDLVEQSQAAERAGKWDDAHNLMVQAEALEQSGGKGGQNVMPLMIRGKNLKEFDADGKMMYDLEEGQLNAWAKEAKAEGFDGLKVTNLSDEAGYGNYRPATHYGIFDPKNIRSRFAKFDPAKADSADILAGVGGIAAAGGALSAMGGEARAQEPVNPDDLDPELGMSEQFDRNPLARTGFDPRAVRQLPFKMRGYKAWTSYEDSTNPGLKSIAHGFSRPFSSDDTAMILGIEALPSMDEGGAQLLMHESGHRALRMLNDTEPDLAKLVDTLRQPKTDTHGGLDGEEVLMRMLDFFGGNEDRRADTEKFFKQRTGKDIFPVIQENIDTLTQVQAFFQKKLMEQGRNPGSIEFRTPEDIAASPRQNDPAGAALSQQDGFDYGALSNVAEGSNGQRSN